MTNFVVSESNFKFKQFFQLSGEAINKLWSSNITGNDWKVYSFLSLVDPFGDRWCELPKIEEICIFLKISKSTFYRSITKLKSEGIIDAEPQGLKFRNILGFSKMRIESQNCDTSVKNEKTVSKMRIESQNCDNEELETKPSKDFAPSQTIQTIQKDHTCSDGETHTNLKYNSKESSIVNEQKYLKNEQVEEDLSSYQKDSQNYPVEKTDTKEEQIFRDCSTKKANCTKKHSPVQPEERFGNGSSALSPVKQRGWNWLPEGEWCVNGKLDPNFQEWLAKKWMNKYQDCDIYESKANVLAYFRNDPAKLPIRWEQYHEEYLHRANNIKVRLDHDCKISDEEKEQAIARVRAVNNVAPEQSVSVVNKSPIETPMIPTEVLPSGDETKEIDKPPIPSNLAESRAENANESANNDSLNLAFQQEKSKNDEKVDIVSLLQEGDKEEEEVPVNHEAKALIQTLINSFGGSNREEKANIPDDPILHSSSEAYNDYDEWNESGQDEWDWDDNGGENDEGANVHQPPYLRSENEPNSRSEIVSEYVPEEKEATEERVSISVGNKSILQIQARMINIALKKEEMRRSPKYKKWEEAFLEIGWSVDYDEYGYPQRIYESDEKLTSPAHFVKSVNQENTVSSNECDSLDSINHEDSEKLKSQANTLNTALKNFKLRTSPIYKKYVEKFLSLGWSAIYDQHGYATEVYL